jgi:large subunit ribosomal protein L17
MLCNMVTSLFKSERITTTDMKAKEARRLAERLITRARKGYTAHQEGLSLLEAGKADEARQMEAVALAHWRQAGRYVRNISVLKKLFEEIAPQYLERPGGYTRIVRLSRRLGDNAQSVFLELVGTEITEKPVSKKGVEDKETGAEKDAKSKPEKDKKTSKETKAKPKSKGKSKSKAKAKDKDKDKDKDKKAGADRRSKAKPKSRPDSKTQTKARKKSAK